MFVGRLLRLVCLAFVILPGFCLAEEFTGRVVGVSDGDTITILHNGVGQKIRLNGIDCPEKRQAFGQRARQFTSDLVFRREVMIVEHGRDKYGRTIGDVKLGDGTFVNRELVRAGLCWWYRKYAQHDRELVWLELEAREAKRGLWVNPEPVPPWEFRHRRKEP